MRLFRLIYYSQPFGYDQIMLNGILVDAKTYNSKNDITGALICRDDIFLQLLEGGKSDVLTTYDKILNDDRHLDVNLLVEEFCENRIFPQWHMKDDPARSWFWTKEQISSGILKTISTNEVIEAFKKVEQHFSE